MVNFANIPSALFVATMASAAAIAPVNVEKRDVYGSGTHFDVGLFVGACGWESDASQFVVAVSAQEYDTYPGYAGTNPNNNPICGRQIWVWGWTGLSPQLATIVDRCAGCAGLDDIDMSDSLFEAVIGDLGIGRSPIGWNWA